FPWGVDTETWEQWIAAAYQGFGLEDLRQRIAPSRSTNKSDQDEMERFFRRQAGSGGTAAFMRMWGGMDIRPGLPLIRVPTLVLHRSDANLMPAAIGRYVAKRQSCGRWRRFLMTVSTGGSREEERRQTADRHRPAPHHVKYDGERPALVPRPICAAP